MTEQEQQERQLRLKQIIELLGRAEAGLSRSRIRLFGEQQVDAAWVRSVDDIPEREDLLESFASKFNRFQNMMGDKLLPSLLVWKGERPGAFIDNLNRAERLGWIDSAELWLEARALRNKLVHEYMLDAEVFAQSLNLANELSLMLLQTWQRIQRYVGGADAAE